MKVFSKSSARYAQTPEPVTPYQRAAQEWDDRIGAATLRARNWRFIAFGILVLAILLAGGLVWRSQQSTITPYVVEVNSTGQIRAVGEAATPYKPNDAQIAFHLSHFITNVRSLSLDPVVVRQNWLDAYNFATDRGAAILNEFARTKDPFSRVGQTSVTVEVTSIVRASDHSYQLRWSERAYQNGALASVERWTAIVTLLIQPPRTEERLRKNPLGIYVDGLNWNRELSASDQKKYPANTN
jgi:type IV secretion system protein VirB5